MLGLLRSLSLTVVIRGRDSMLSPLMYLESGRRCCRTLVNQATVAAGVLERLKKPCPRRRWAISCIGRSDAVVVARAAVVVARAGHVKH
jgi:hypothetical protein